MGKSIGQLYKTARKHLKLSQKKIANDLNVSDVLISQIETGRTQSPNHEYTKYLVERGVNYFYLAGLSDEIEGELMEMVSKEDYKLLQSKNEDLQNQLTKLEGKYETLRDILEVDVDEDGNVRKRNPNL